MAVESWSAPEGSWASSEATRKKMRGNRSRDTSPELRVRSLVHRRGLRYRVAQRPIPTLRRTADLVFRRAKVAVNVDGCFWHGCEQHYKEPKTNTEYWMLYKANLEGAKLAGASACADTVWPEGFGPVAAGVTFE